MLRTIRKMKMNRGKNYLELEPNFNTTFPNRRRRSVRIDVME